MFGDWKHLTTLLIFHETFTQLWTPVDWKINFNTEAKVQISRRGVTVS